MTEFEQYFTGLLDGKIVACEKMKRIADVLLEQYYSPGEYHFDFDIAKRHIDFIEKFCKIPSGGNWSTVKTGTIPEGKVPGNIWLRG